MHGQSNIEALIVTICCICIQRHRNCIWTKWKCPWPLWFVLYTCISRILLSSTNVQLPTCSNSVCRTIEKSVKNIFYISSCLFVKNNNSMREFVSEKIFHCKPNLAQSLNLYSTHCVDNLSCPLIRNFFFARTQQFLSE